MKFRTFLFGLASMLAVAFSMQTSLAADSSSKHRSKHHKKDKCCKQTKKLVEEINRTTTQDYIVDTNTNFLAQQINQTVQADLIVDEEVLDIVTDIASCGCYCQTQILPSDFADADGNLTLTYVISEPGSYCLAESIEWAPIAPEVIDYTTPSVAIIIDSDDVYLNLAGNVLAQANDVEACVGILVLTDNQNVTIVNGEVQDFSYLGIYVQGDTQDIFLGNADTNLLVNNCGYGSEFQYVDEPSGLPINPGGILIGESYGILSHFNGPVVTAKLENVFAENNGYAGCTVGIHYDMSIKNCTFSGNYDERVAAPYDSSTYIFGLLYYASTNFDDISSFQFSIENSHFDGNSVENDTTSNAVFGALIGYNYTGLVVRNCTFTDNGAAGGIFDATFGLSIGGGIAALVEDSQANYNYGDYVAEGFNLSGFDSESIIASSGAIFRGLQASGNNVVGSGPFAQAVGIACLFANGVSIEDCVAVNNTAYSVNGDTTTIAAGILLSGTDVTQFDNEEPLSSLAGDMSVVRCYVAENAAGNIENPSNGASAGVFIQSPIFDVVVKESVAQNNGGVTTNAGIVTQRLLIDSEFYNILVDECAIQNQDYGIYSGGDNDSIYQNNTISYVGFGIFLSGSTEDSVNNNYVNNADVGYTDTADVSSSVFSNNRAFDVTTPFNVTYSFGPAPLTQGTLTAGFPSGSYVYNTSGTLTVSQTGTTTITGGAGTQWTTQMVGGTIMVANGDTAVITAVTSANTLTVNKTFTYSGESYIIVYPVGPSDNVIIN